VSALRILPWLYWPVAAVLAARGLVWLLDEHQTLGLVATLLFVLATIAMIVRADDRSSDLASVRRQLASAEAELRLHGIRGH
jgi:predicted branched-subunit amino acid permease